MQTRLEKQIRFITEIDKVKKVYRQTLLTDGSRNENDAEHSWHLAIMAVLLEEYCPGEVDLLKVIKMVLIHDLVEIDAGDTFCYDAKANESKAYRETMAAKRIFGLLPDDQREELKSMWEEFEERTTLEAKFAVCLDRLQPLIHNYLTQGHTWMKYDVPSSKVWERMAPIRDMSPELWSFVQFVIEDSINQGILRK